MFLVEELNCEKFVIAGRNLNRGATSGDAFGLKIGVDRSGLTVAFS